mgnify:FL=1
MSKKIEPYKDIAMIYDQVRPSYPTQLIQDIITATNIEVGSTLLEIGAGTGKATVLFADKGFKIHAVEIGKDMGKILKEKCHTYPNVSVEIASFEEWIPENIAKYNMIFSAQAFHWLDVTVKYKKCYNLLKEDGYLVLFWYNSRDMTEEAKIINQKINEIIQKYANMQSNETKPERATHSGVFKNDERKVEIEDSGLFDIVDILQYRSEIKNNAEQYLKAQKSVPAIVSILDGLDEETIHEMEEKIENEINNNGGYVETIFDYSLYIAKKVEKNKD